MLKKITNMEAELQALTEDAEVCLIFLHEVPQCMYTLNQGLDETTRTVSGESNVCVCLQVI